MKSILLLGFCALILPLAVVPVANAQTTHDAKTLAITHVTVIDATGAPAMPDMTVTIRDGRIAMIKKSSRKPPKNAQIIDGRGKDGRGKDGRSIDGRGKFLIPGLWDMHVHTNFGDWIPDGEELVLPLFVANGVTGVRDMGGDLELLKKWRSEISAGTIIGPRMVIAGPMVDGLPPHFPASLPVTTAEDGRKAVDDLKQGGADFIKVQSYIPRDAYFAVADEAKKQGIVFVGHVPDAIRAAEASNAGQKSIEHYTGIFEGCSTKEKEDEFLKGPKGPRRVLEAYDEKRCTALIALLAKNQTWQVPTLYWEHGQWLIDDLDLSQSPGAEYAAATLRNKTYKQFTDSILKELDTDPVEYRRQFVAKELEMTLAMHRAGVPLMAGTDTEAGVYVIPGFSLHQELELFVKAGLTPMEALQTATLNPAKFLGRTQDLGTIEPGKLADLVLLDASPLDDIRNTQKISAVFLGGRYFSRTDLDGILDRAKAVALTK